MLIDMRKKIGCSNVSIALTLVGVLPLIGGGSGLVQVIRHLESGIEFGWLFSASFMTVFGLLSCGYRSCLYVQTGYGVFVRKMLGFTFREDRFDFSEFDEILVDTFRSRPAEGRSTTSYYSVRFVGQAKSIDIGDFLRFRRYAGDARSFSNIQKLVHELVSVSSLPVRYSDKVKQLNNLAD